MLRLRTKQERDMYRRTEIANLQKQTGTTVQHVYNLIVVRFVSQFNDGVRPMVKIWKANAARPHAHYYFRSEQKREDYIARQIAAAESHITRTARYKARRENDNSLSNRRIETKAVKLALAKYGINAKVEHGKGTAWGWLTINVGNGQQFGEHILDEYQTHRNCPRCQAIHRISDFAENLAQKITGRSGEYGGRISSLTQDNWSQAKKCSVPIVHDLKKLRQAIPELQEVD